MCSVFVPMNICFAVSAEHIVKIYRQPAENSVKTMLSADCHTFLCRLYELMNCWTDCNFRMLDMLNNQTLNQISFLNMRFHLNPSFSSLEIMMNEALPTI